MKSWFSIQNKADANSVLDISIHDEIGLWGISAKEFISDLMSYDNVKAINLSIHSPGGSVLDGFAMYNSLKHHPAHITGRVEGIAASAASTVLMASDYITMPEDSFLMIHNACGVAVGDSDDMRQVADTIDKLQDSIVNIYVKRTCAGESDIRGMMQEETWMNANDALENNFIDSISSPVGVSNKINGFSRYFKNLPVDIDGCLNINSEKEYERHLRDVCGCSRSQAKGLIAKAKSIFQRDADNGEDLDQLTAALNRLYEKFN